MAEQKVEFRKIRDFGENLNDTFLFIRQNLRPLLLSFFAICGVFMLGKAIFSGMYQSQSFSVFDRLLRKDYDTRTVANPFSSLFSFEYLLLLTFSWLSYNAMTVTLGSYIKLYVANGGVQPSVQDVWTVFKKYFFRVFIYSIPVALLICVGMLFCLVPGVYLLVVLMPFNLILIIEDLSFGEAFNRCFLIIKNNYWISLAIYLVATIIYSFAGMIVGMIIGAVVGISTYFTTRSIGTSAGVMTSFLDIFGGVFYIVFFVSAALQYFNLTEQHDGTGVLERLDTLGATPHTVDNTGEEY